MKRYSEAAEKTGVWAEAEAEAKEKAEITRVASEAR